MALEYKIEELGVELKSTSSEESQSCDDTINLFSKLVLDKHS